MPDILGAIKKVKAAEEAVWGCLIDVVKNDIGELAQWLDTTQPPEWRLTSKEVVVPLRLPDCTEIALKYVRPRRDGRSDSDYVLEWEPCIWSGRLFGEGSLRRDTCGKFGVVRYRLEPYPPDAPKLVPEQDKFCTNNFEAARIAASGFGKEKRQLEEQAKQMARDFLDQLRATAGRRG